MSAPAPKFSELDFEKDYDENKDQDYSPGDDIDTYNSPLDTSQSLLESGTRSLKQGKIPLACSLLAESCQILAQEHGEFSDLCAEAYHQYGLALLEWSRMEGQVFEYTMEGFNLGQSGQTKVVVEETKNLSPDELKEIEEKVSDALEENFDAFDIAAKIHFEEESGEDSSEESETSDDEDKDDDENKDDDEDKVVEDLKEATNLELSWEVLELARIIYTRSGQKEKLGEVLLALGEVSMERQDYGQAARDFTESLVNKMAVLPKHSRLLAEVYFHLGTALAYWGKFPTAEVNFTSAVSILEARKKIVAETADLQDIAEMSDLDVCIQEIKEVIEEHREMHKEVLTVSSHCHRLAAKAALTKQNNDLAVDTVVEEEQFDCYWFCGPPSDQLAKAVGADSSETVEADSFLTKLSTPLAGSRQGGLVKTSLGSVGPGTA